MGNSQNDQEIYVELFIPGKPMGIRSIHSILMIVESAFVWSTIAIPMNEREGFHNKWMKLSGKESEQAREKRDQIDDLLSPLNNSYKKYLTEKYEKLFLNAVDEAKNSVISSQVQSFAAIFALQQFQKLAYSDAETTDQKEKPLRGKDLHRLFRDFDRDFGHEFFYEFEHFIDRYIQRDRYGTKRWFENYIDNRGLGKENFDLDEFQSWVGIEFEQNLIPTKEISTAKSISFIFDISALIAIFGMQHIPVAKDIIVYAFGVLREWKGGSISPRKGEVLSPHL